MNVRLLPKAVIAIYKLAMEKHREIPWPRILVEGAVIIVSILLAFGIDAWWDGRQELEEEQRLLLALKSEFETNLSKIEEQLKYRQAVVSSITQIFEAAAGQTAVTTEELDQLIGDTVWWSTAKIKYCPCCNEKPRNPYSR